MLFYLFHDLIIFFTGNRKFCQNNEARNVNRLEFLNKYPYLRYLLQHYGERQEFNVIDIPQVNVLT